MAILCAALLAACEEEPEGTPLNPQTSAAEVTPAEDAVPARERDEASQTWTAQGSVESVNQAEKQITISHGPVEALGWPAMTMPFGVEDATLLQAVTAGDSVTFTFREGAAGQYVVQDLEVKGGEQ